jgi:hypothetical protein
MVFQSLDDGDAIESKIGSVSSFSRDPTQHKHIRVPPKLNTNRLKHVQCSLNCHIYLFLMPTRDH